MPDVYENPSDNPNGNSLWLYVGIGTAAVTVIGLGLGIWYWISRKDEPAAPKGPAAPPGYKVEQCESFRDRTLCVLKDLETGLVASLTRYHWRVGEGSVSETGYVSPDLAMAKARQFVDSLEDEPLPGDESVEPEATEEPGGPQVQLSTGTAAHGITVETVDGVCQAFSLNDLAAWIPYASELLDGLNMAAWTSEELMDRVWKATFPACGDHLSKIAGVTIGGTPYAAVVQAGQDFLDQEVIALSGTSTIESVFAGFMVGETYIAPPVDPVVQINLGPDAPEVLQYAKPDSDDMFWIVTTLKPVMLPGGPSQESTWRLWGPNTLIVGDPVAEGSTGSRSQSMDKAKHWIATHGIAAGA